MSTRIADLRLRPVSGRGLVGRLPGLAVVVLATDEAAGAVLDACTAGDDAGAVVERLRALGTARPLPPFVVLADTVAGLHVLAHDGMEVTFGTEAGDERRSVATGQWLDVVRTAPFTRVTAASAGVDPIADDRLDLAAGIVPAAALVAGPELATVAPAPVADASLDGSLAPAPPPAPAPPSSPTPAAAPPTATPAAPAPPAAVPSVTPTFSSVLLLDAEAEPDDSRPPLPVASAAPAPPRPRVLGILCSRGHFNDPQAYYCDHCGISMVHQTHNLVEGDRPSLGFLVFDDGATYTLDQDYVVGREPDADPRITSGEARVLLLDDAARTVSRVHAEVRLDGWRVTVVDRGSTNGSFVWMAATSQWQRLTADVPVALEPGQHASFGQRAFRFESPHDQR